MTYRKGDFPVRTEGIKSSGLTVTLLMSLTFMGT